MWEKQEFARDIGADVDELSYLFRTLAELWGAVSFRSCKSSWKDNLERAEQRTETGHVMAKNMRAGVSGGRKGGNRLGSRRRSDHQWHTTPPALNPRSRYDTLWVHGVD